MVGAVIERYFISGKGAEIHRSGVAFEVLLVVTRATPYTLLSIGLIACAL